MSLFTEQKINIAASDVAPIQTLTVAGNASIAGSQTIGTSLTVGTTVAVGSNLTVTGIMQSGSVQSGAISSTGSIRSSAAATATTSGVGYNTGAGGAVTQLVNRSTAVILNALCGSITLFTVAGTGTNSFTVTNSAVAATDVILLNQRSGTDKYTYAVNLVAAGSFQITLTTAGVTVEAPVISFAVIKAVTA